jgi:hypothetical protein
MGIQAFVTTILPDLLQVSMINYSEPIWWAIAVVRVTALLLGFRYLLKSRNRMAKFSDKRLSRFLSDSLMVPAFLLICVLVFFPLDPISCRAEFPDNIDEMCERTLLG